MLTLLGVALAARLAQAGPSADEIASRAARASAAEVERLAGSLGEAAAAAAEPRSLQQAADAYGALVERVQQIDDARGALAATLAAGERIERALAEARQRREDAAGEDEAALEGLYRSTDWQRLGYATSTLHYWRGWALLARGRSLAAGAERASSLEAARSSFAHSARALGQPRLAMGGLLGLGLTHLELGDLDAADAALKRLEAQLERGGSEVDPALLGRSLRARATVALRRGDATRAAALAGRIPPEQLSRGEERQLARLRAEAELSALREGSGDPARAAASLRALAGQGEEGARAAGELAQRFWAELRDQDVGAVGLLLAADEAYDAQRYEAAAALYPRALARAAEIPGLDAPLVRYRQAVSLSRTGRAAAATPLLERVLADSESPTLRRDAALLLFAVAESLLAEGSGGGPEAPAAERQALALRAAQELLRIAPDGPAADRARMRVARAREAARDARGAAESLAGVDPESPDYPGARYDLARLRAAELEALEARGRADAPAARRLGRELSEDLETLEGLAAQGRLALPAERLATLAVLRARAARWAGAAPALVLERVEAARQHPALGAAEQRVLLDLELHSLLATKRFDRLEEIAAARADAEIRRDWPLWRQTLSSLEAGEAPARTRLAWCRRLLPLSRDDGERAELELARAHALLDGGDARAAARATARLVETDPGWGDAWLLHARALERAGDTQAAAAAWGRVADGVETGSPRWVEATLAQARAAFASDAADAACRALERLADAELEAGARREADALRRRCAPRQPVSGPGSRS